MLLARARPPLQYRNWRGLRGTHSAHPTFAFGFTLLSDRRSKLAFSLREPSVRSWAPSTPYTRRSPKDPFAQSLATAASPRKKSCSLEQGHRFSIGKVPVFGVHIRLTLLLPSVSLYFPIVYTRSHSTFGRLSRSSEGSLRLHGRWSRVRARYG